MIKNNNDTTRHPRVHLLITISLGCILCISASGCSMFKGKGKGDANSEISERDLAAQREGRFGSGSIPTAEGSGLFRDVPFGYDSYALEDEARSAIEANAQTLIERTELKITVEGHCDERGTNEYNMALGAERARAVKSALVALGVSSARINTTSYGEEIPLDPGHSESAYATNRRAHFSVGQDELPATGEAAPTRGSDKKKY
jgi:peptidoglycan-associated lipoprotein